MGLGVVPNWAWGVLGCKIGRPPPVLSRLSGNTSIIAVLVATYARRVEFLEFSDKHVPAPKLVRHSRAKLGGPASLKRSQQKTHSELDIRPNTDVLRIVV